MHIPVLLKEVIENINLKVGDVVLDATVGGGGHAVKILENIVPGGRLIAFDKDAEAIERTKERLKSFRDAVTFVNEDFRKIGDILGSLGVDGIDGVLFDIGMSSFLVDDAQRGFSFLKDGPLDMRFDVRQKLSAQDVVNKFRRDELADIIKEYGQERHSRLIAGAICSARKKRPVRTTSELTDIIVRAAGGRYSRQRLHPAARTFQALRIYVNDELGALEEGLKGIFGYMRSGARICVISFHSLEDRIVKNIFRDAKKAGELSIITKKPVCPEWEEVKANPRARSAKLRVAERV